VALVASSSITRHRVGGIFGQVDELSMRASMGTGIVPKWVSLVNLGGWALIVVGLILAAVTIL
jgi:hypothetical protein